GILGFVVKWLLSHITELTNTVNRMVESRDAVVRETRVDFKEALREIVTGHNDAMGKVTEHCEKEIERQMAEARIRDDKIDKGLTDLREVMEDLRDRLPIPTH